MRGGNRDILSAGWADRFRQALDDYALALQLRVSLWVWNEVQINTPVFDPRPGDPPGYPKQRGGRAKFGWHIEFNRPGSEGPATSEQTAQQRVVQKLQSARRYYEVWVTNNVPHARVLEFGGYPNPPKGGTGRTIGGYSTQAPNGMARNAVRKAPQVVDGIARELFREKFGL